MENWKTTIGGILMALGTIATQAPIPSKFGWIPALVSALGGALTGTMAKDYSNHSTQAEINEATVEKRQ